MEVFRQRSTTVLSLLLTLSALSLGALGALFGDVAQAATAPRRGGTLVIAREIDADMYDPHKVTALAAAEVHFMLGDTLVVMDYDLKTVKPHLAKSWTVSEDGTLYTFYLRDDVKFHSGRPVTAADVEYSFKRWISPETRSPVAWRAGPVKDIRAVDDYTLEYELTEPFPELLLQLTQNFAIIIDREAVERYGDQFGVSGFGATGPYKWVQWVPRDVLILERFEDYTWGSELYENKGPAYPDRVVWRVIPEETTRVLALESGQVHTTIYVPPRELARLQRTPGIRVEQIKPYLWTYYVGFKITRPNVSDVRVRRAIIHAVNMDLIVNALLFGAGEPAWSWFHPDTLDFWREWGDHRYEYNPDLARQLLDEAGWVVGPDGIRVKDGQRLQVRVVGFNSALYQEPLTAMQAMLRQVGVELVLELLDATVTWARLREQDFEMFTMSYPYISAGDALNLYASSANIPAPNRMNWNDPETDMLLRKGKTALTDEERYEAYARVQQIVHEAALWLPMFHLHRYMASSTKVHGLKPHGIYGVGYYQMLDAWVER